MRANAVVSGQLSWLFIALTLTRRLRFWGSCWECVVVINAMPLSVGLEPFVKIIINIFLKGLLVVLPLVITFGLLYWMFSGAEEILRIPLKMILPVGWYVPGMGVVSACGLIFVCGLLVQSYLVKPFFSLLEFLLNRIPIVKTLYGGARDLMKFAIGDKEEGMQKVVSVEIKEGVFLIGFVTNEEPEFSDKDCIAVFFPMSYQMGGYLAYVERSKCEPLDMPVDQAMQKILMADMVKKRQP